MQTFDMTFICKKCKKAFRKDAREFEDAYVRTQCMKLCDIR
jgi:hypothetical protein